MSPLRTQHLSPSSPCFFAPSQPEDSLSVSLWIAHLYSPSAAFQSSRVPPSKIAESRAEIHVSRRVSSRIQRRSIERLSSGAIEVSRDVAPAETRRPLRGKVRSFVRARHFRADQSGIHKVARPELLWRNSSPGGSREDEDAKEEAVLKSEKLNYIAVKNDARGFSVS